MLIRRKIAGSALRRLKTKRKLRPLRSRKNAARKYSSKSGLKFREMMGGGDKLIYLVYYGTPNIRSNKDIRLLHTFVGVLFYNQPNWILCVSSELADKPAHFTDVLTQSKVPVPDDGYTKEILDGQTERLKPTYEAMYKIVDDLIVIGDGAAAAAAFPPPPSTPDDDVMVTRAANDILCQFIKRLCTLTPEQETTLKTYLEDDKNVDEVTVRTSKQSSSFHCDFKWIFTFNKNIFSSGGDLSAYLDQKPVKVLEKVMPVDDPKMYGLNQFVDTSQLPTAARDFVVTNKNNRNPSLESSMNAKYPSSNFKVIIREAIDFLEFDMWTGPYDSQETFNKIIGTVMTHNKRYFPKDREIVQYVNTLLK